MKHVLSTFTLGSINVYYLKDAQGQLSFSMCPSSKADQVTINDATKSHALVQAKLMSDGYDKNFSNGISMFHSQTTQGFCYQRQQVDEDDQQISIQTQLTDRLGNRYTHVIEYIKGTDRLIAHTEFENMTAQVQQLALLSSFCLSGLSPFHQQNPTGQLDLLRFRSKWSMEGRLEQRPIETYDLEPSWKPSGLAVEKFGQLGSMPVRRFFPMVGLVDRQVDVTWLVQLAVPASWQIEALRLDDDVILTGGLPDSDYGQWQPTVQPGAKLKTPNAYLTVGTGRLEKVAHQLTEPVQTVAKLPVIFNEWAASWGQPTEQNVLDTVDILKHHAIDSYVIDAGWFANADGNWQTNHGDWQVNPHAFPHGLKPVVTAIHQAGLKAGLWFEFETVGADAVQFKNTRYLAKKYGHPITAGTRRFWDMRCSWVLDYLQQAVVKTLSDNQFDYLKIDYNDNLGVGVDDDSGLGVGLQNLVAGTLTWIKKLKHDHPTVTIENCSSGGHRLTTPFIESTDLSSFSDAHETTSIPIIAANELNLLPASKNLIWVVLHAEASAEQLIYRLASGFLGRICLSGQVMALTTKQWQLVDQALAMYQQCHDLIAQGTPFRFGPSVLSYQRPQGWQVAGFSDCSELDLANHLLVVAHSFEHDQSQQISLPEVGDGWRLVSDFGSDDWQLTQTEKLNLHVGITNFTAHVWLLERSV